ncbi:MAG: DUF2442 domain-containing protein [Bacilli bacterium]|nr:DUF2442 domain-containing protein [Bacilli bacterium]
MHHTIRSIYIIEKYKISVLFVEGVTKIWDLEPWFSKYPKFNDLKNDKTLFEKVKVDVGGYGIIWNDDLDMDCNTIYDEGQLVHSIFDGLISLSEASKLWNLNESTLRKAIAYGKLIPGVDACKFSNQWLITKEAMFREYGEMRN